MTFASLVIERELLDVAGLPAAVAAWLRDAGVIAAVCILIFLLAFFLQRRWVGRVWSAVDYAFAALAALSFAGYLAFGVLVATLGTVRVQAPQAGGDPRQTPSVTAYRPSQTLALTVAGGAALAATAVPILVGIFGALKWRRIWALAILSIKEARAKGILWICLIIPLIYLYADWYMPSHRPEDQLKQRVKIAYFALSILFILSAVLLGSFSIPTDVKTQTIHTIVTKPVQRYEIVLGRFVGYSLLLGAELMVLTGLSLWYVTRGISPEAVRESQRARQPLFADKLTFHNTKGESVGREWEYRSYISNYTPGTAKQYAVWEFARLPSSLGNRDTPAPVEWTLDIFRTTKGNIEKDQGVLCTFLFISGQLDVPQVEAMLSRYTEERIAGSKDPQIDDKLAEKYGIFVASGQPVSDYRTGTLQVPAGLFRKLYADQSNSPLAMKILVTMEPSSGPQLLGMARRDLYVLAGEGWFALNFFKGALGLWFTSLLVLGIALACSTYLSGVISLLVTLFLCGAGLFIDYIRSVAFGTSSGGGPFESAYRLANRQGMVIELDKSSTAVNVFQALDEGFRWYLRAVMNIFPDVSRFDLTAFVANGYDISWSQVVFADALVPLLGYLIPCGVLAYYLMASREIANPT